MALVFAESEVTAAGILYADRTGISYQYPTRYRRLIQPGERFVYYKGRRRHDGSRAPQVYFGTGVVGTSEPDAAAPDRLSCEILDYHAFLKPVPFKDASGQYFETSADRRGYFQPGVRKISDEEFARILAAAEFVDDSASEDPEAVGHRAPVGGGYADMHVQPGPTYASPKIIRAIEEFAVQVALDELRRRFPKFTPKPQPRNNPGFDILLAEQAGNHNGNDCFYVEVKGTTRRLPVFFVTEGELQFSRRNAKRFRLVLVYKIQLAQRTYEVFWHEGAIADDAGFRLCPVQWSCEVVGVSRGPDRHRDGT
ncbi:MAG: DUF3883 domain-containing protein [Deltaproteobacteria bacterium]|nr:MAG: DUF3883 domain-containing protein [Deltaproteobacteria bacterium]TMQ08278.1 MAG: DUF3883 domain-containing protein [Deltaproteobacteria bacterium]